MEVNEESDQKSDIYPHWMAAHAHLKNEFTEDKKCQNLMSWWAGSIVVFFLKSKDIIFSVITVIL